MFFTLFLGRRYAYAAMRHLLSSAYGLTTFINLSQVFSRVKHSLVVTATIQPAPYAKSHSATCG